MLIFSRRSDFNLFHTHFFNTSSIILRSSFNSTSVNPYTLPNAEGFSIFKPYFTPPPAAFLWARWQLQISYSFLTTFKFITMFLISYLVAHNWRLSNIKVHNRVNTSLRHISHSVSQRIQVLHPCSF